MKMDLQNLQGWLKVYFIYLLIGVGLGAISIGQGVVYSIGLYWTSMNLLGLGLHGFAAYALTQTGRPWVRGLQIALNGVSAFLLLAAATGFGFGPFFGWIILAPVSGLIYQILPYDMIQPMYVVISAGSAALALAWTVYWVVSARVKDTYITPVPAPGASPDMAPDVVSDTAPDSPAESEQIQGGYVTEQDAAGGFAHQSAGTNPVAKPGMGNLQKGCLIALGLLLVAGLIFAAMVIATLEAWFG